MNKLEAICKFLDTDYSKNSDDCAVSENYPQENVYEYLNEEYLVLTDEEADKACYEYIKNNLWVFNSKFISYYIEAFDSLEQKDFYEAIQTLEQIREKLCESSNAVFLSLVGNQLDRLIADAIASDGRGHFLATYDGEENEEGEYFIYQI